MRVPRPHGPVLTVLGRVSRMETTSPEGGFVGSPSGAVPGSRGPVRTRDGECCRFMLHPRGWAVIGWGVNRGQWGLMARVSCGWRSLHALQAGWGGVLLFIGWGGLLLQAQRVWGTRSFKAEGGAEISPAVLDAMFPLLGLCCSGGWVLSLGVVLLCLLHVGGGTLTVAVKMSSGFSDSQSL